MATQAHPDVLGELIAAAGAAALRTDDATLALYGQDVFSRGARPLGVLRPTSTDALAAALTVAARHGLAIVPRGGGMSYTGGYLSDRPGALVVDTGGMDRVLEVDETDMTVTVEAGCTWAKLYEALRPRRLRPPFWGTLSGRYATVGGGMSQNGAFWGGGHGSAADSALSFTVVLADGSVVDTGSAFFRPYGPDLTGLFAADTGAFGVKATVTLRLIREAAAFGFVSYSFASFEDQLAALSAVAREGLASEAFGFDPFLQAQRMQRESLGSDAKALLGVMKAQGSVLGALRQGARIVAAGRSFLDGVPYSAHFTCEARTQGHADSDAAEVDRIVRSHGGTPVDATIPTVMRANPFGPVNSMLRPRGERWVPVHGVVPHSRAASTYAAIRALYDQHAAAMTNLGVGAGSMVMSVGTTGMLIEPVLFWPDAIDDLHRAAVEPAHLARLPLSDANPAARALVETLRARLVDLFFEARAVHFQIGRTYRWSDSLAPGARTIVAALKTAVDPYGRMNPGSLGL